MIELTPAETGRLIVADLEKRLERYQVSIARLGGEMTYNSGRADGRAEAMAAAIAVVKQYLGG